MNEYTINLSYWKFEKFKTYLQMLIILTLIRKDNLHGPSLTDEGFDIAGNLVIITRLKIITAKQLKKMLNIIMSKLILIKMKRQRQIKWKHVPTQSLNTERIQWYIRLSFLKPTITLDNGWLLLKDKIWIGDSIKHRYEVRPTMVLYLQRGVLRPRIVPWNKPV